MNTPRNPVGWFEIYVQDMERAKTFYEKTFGQTLEQLPNPQLEMWAFPGVCDGCSPSPRRYTGSITAGLGRWKVSRVGIRWTI